jgi:hypothetical protein
MGNPGGNECFDTRGSRFGGKGSCFNLKGGSVDHCEDAGVASGRGEGGPTMSTWAWEKQHSGMGIGREGGRT